MDEIRELVRARYAAAAAAVRERGGRRALDMTGRSDEGCCSAGCCAPEGIDVDSSFGAGLYHADDAGDLPAEALAASLGCGNPLAVAQLSAGEHVLDLGSGGGIDVLLSARRVGPSGFVYGVDMTDEMLDLARANATKAGATNVEFLKGAIEDVPLPANAVDVVISNCVINLSTDKPRVLREAARVLRTGGRLGICDVVAEDHVSMSQRAERGSHVGCIAGALSRGEYLDALRDAGFLEREVEFTHEVAPGMHGAIIRAVKPPPTAPATAPATTAQATRT